MARTKGAKNLTPEERERRKKEKAAKSGNVAEHDRIHLEDLTDEQEHALVYQHKRQYEAALKRKKDADADLKNIAKKAKAELGANAIDQIKLIQSLESDEGKRQLRERIGWQAKIARWEGMPTGHIDDLFPEDREPIEDKAFAEGRRAGLAGDDNAAPHHYDGPLKSRWQDGYNAGQEVLSKGFKPIAKVGEDFGAEPDEEPIDWRAKGAKAFTEGQNGKVPEDVPEEHGEDWLEGWSRASEAHAKRMDANNRTSAAA